MVDTTLFNPTVAGSAGGMVSITADLARFWQAASCCGRGRWPSREVLTAEERQREPARPHRPLTDPVWSVAAEPLSGQVVAPRRAEVGVVLALLSARDGVPQTAKYPACPDIVVCDEHRASTRFCSVGSRLRCRSGPVTELLPCGVSYQEGQ